MGSSEQGHITPGLTGDAIFGRSLGFFRTSLCVKETLDRGGRSGGGGGVGKENDCQPKQGALPSAVSAITADRLGLRRRAAGRPAGRLGIRCAAVLQFLEHVLVLRGIANTTAKLLVTPLQS